MFDLSSALACRMESIKTRQMDNAIDEMQDKRRKKKMEIGFISLHQYDMDEIRQRLERLYGGLYSINITKDNKKPCHLSYCIVLSGHVLTFKILYCYNLNIECSSLYSQIRQYTVSILYTSAICLLRQIIWLCVKQYRLLNVRMYEICLQILILSRV